MKTKIILGLLSASALTALLTAPAWTRHHPAPAVPPAQTFLVRGEIRGIDRELRTVRIAHEAIPDYMPAMIMPFTVKHGEPLDGIAVGEAIQFELSVTEDDSWISHLEVIRPPRGDESSAATAALADPEAERLHPGEMLPDLQLTDQNGRPFRLSDLRGKAVVLTFIYTRCPLPNFCPLMSKNFAELQSRFENEFPGRVELVSVTMDPEFDRPSVLKAYSVRYGKIGPDWKFATGRLDQIDSLAGAVGLNFKRENGLITHDLRTALIGPDGRLVHVWKSNVWTPYEVQTRVRETLTGRRDLVSR